ncbi:MAG: septum site-determining protein MinC [Deinococcales bacterium]
MKLRGTTGGLNLLLEPLDTRESVTGMLESRANLLSEAIEIELGGVVSWAVFNVVQQHIQQAGGQISSLRPPRDSSIGSNKTEVVPRTMRAGTRIEKAGNVIVLGDVNPGAELIAGGDIIVSGTLRGMAHAGVSGREGAIIYAQRIAATQVRIAHALARAPEGSSLDAMRVAPPSDVAEIAKLESGQIVIEPYKP